MPLRAAPAHPLVARHGRPRALAGVVAWAVRRAVVVVAVVVLAGGATGCAPSAGSCADDEGCASFGARCVDGACRVACNDATECAPGAQCVDGRCGRCLSGDACDGDDPARQDAGAPRDDAGRRADAGAAGDAGAANDAGTDDDDAGGDAGQGGSDGGFVAADGGFVAGEDGGLVAVDGGFLAVDGGRVDDAGAPVDAGPPGPDAGVDVVPGDWWDPAWTTRLRLDVDPITEPEAPTDVPVLVVLTPARFDASLAQPDGSDVRFVDDTGALMPHELVVWDPSGTSSFWVRLPVLDGSPFWLYAGNEGPPVPQIPSSAWDDDFLAVWHLDGDLDDAAQRVPPGTSSAVDLSAAGIVAGAASFNDAARASFAGTVDYAEGTMSLWAKTSTTPGDGDIEVMAYASLGAGNGWGGNTEAMIATYAGGFAFVDIETTDGGVREVGEIAPIVTDGQWHHIATSWRAGGDLRLVVDGVVTDTTPYVGDLFEVSTSTTLGAPFANQRFYTGLLDEVRVSDVERTPGELLAEYTTVNDDLLAYGVELTGGVTIATSGASVDVAIGDVPAGAQALVAVAVRPVVGVSAYVVVDQVETGVTPIAIVCARRGEVALALFALAGPRGASTLHVELGAPTGIVAWSAIATGVDANVPPRIAAAANVGDCAAAPLPDDGLDPEVVVLPAAPAVRADPLIGFIARTPSTFTPIAPATSLGSVSANGAALTITRRPPGGDGPVQMGGPLGGDVPQTADLVGVALELRAAGP